MNLNFISVKIKKAYLNTFLLKRIKHKKHKFNIKESIFVLKLRSYILKL